jgi:hypothetical protein
MCSFPALQLYVPCFGVPASQRGAFDGLATFRTFLRSIVRPRWQDPRLGAQAWILGEDAYGAVQDDRMWLISNATVKGAFGCWMRA